ncbi:MAG: GNAT family N-acetyltransferase [Planctomycetales bacterium]|nr:GNAT family N-acetyltransferase [Planctomycetales bacterium]
MSQAITSERLELVAMTADFIRASLEGDIGRARAMVPYALPAGWPACTDPGWRDASGLLARRLRQLEDAPTLEPWLIRAIVPRNTKVMAGFIGFHDAPGAPDLDAISPGAAEFGYTVFPPYRRRGYAREASIALMDWARQTHGVTRFIVSIRPDNVASQALAASLGFVRIGSHLDEVDGLEDILECDLSVRGFHRA